MLSSWPRSHLPTEDFPWEGYLTREFLGYRFDAYSVLLGPNWPPKAELRCSPPSRERDPVSPALVTLVLVMPFLAVLLG